MNQLSTRQVNQRGAVSLFSVVFATLLFTIVTVGFITLMLSSQRQATVSELSQSAYDSAIAGVEDAKRLLVKYYDCIDSANINEPSCQRAINVFRDGTTECGAIASAGIAGEPGSDETLIAQSQNANDDDAALAMLQAYTCVKLSLNTDDFLGSLPENSGGQLVPLKGVSPFDAVAISWFSQADLEEGALSLPSSISSPLPAPSDWPSSQPPLLRAQFIRPGNEFRLTDFDSAEHSSTLFLYPHSVGSTEVSINFDGVRSDGTPSQISPLHITCSDTLTRAYFCRAIVDLEDETNNAYLYLSALYNKANFRVELLRDGATVQFDGVQPAVDSTGRANDLFRRVESRIQMSSDTVAYPAAAFTVEKNLCKNFLVTDSAGDYESRCDFTSID